MVRKMHIVAITMMIIRMTIIIPEGSKYPIFKDSVPKNITLMALGTRVLEYWVLGHSGNGTESQMVSFSQELDAISSRVWFAISSHMARAQGHVALG